MAQFPKATFYQIKLEGIDHTTVTFKGRGQSIALTIDLPNLNALVAASMNTLRAAQQQKSQTPEFLMSGTVGVDHMIPLQVDQWQVSTVDKLSGLVVLHIVAAGGLYLTYTLDQHAIRSIVEAVQNAAPSEPASGLPREIH